MSVESPNAGKVRSDAKSPAHQTASFIWRRPYLAYWIGWLVLPIANFGEEARDPQFFFQVIGMALPGQFVWNRAFVLGLLAWVWICLHFSLGFLSNMPQKKPVAWNGLTDLPIMAWIASPLLSGFWNPSSLWDDAWQAGYLAVVWGGPYLLGRASLTTAPKIEDSFRLFCMLGVCTLLPATVEFFMGRFLYESLYGPHPYVLEGATRYFGYRPLLLFEDPNQIGMWWATLAILASGLLLTPGLDERKPKPIYLVLLAPVFVFQAVGGSLLTLAGFAALRVRSFRPRRSLLLAAVLLAVLGFFFRGPLVSRLKEFAKTSSAGRSVNSAIKEIGLGSFTWRLSLEEREAASSPSPWTGSGHMQPWLGKAPNQRPWGLLSLAAGAWGPLAPLSLVGFLLVPAIVHLTQRPSGGEKRGRDNILLVICTICCMHLVDSLLNSAFLVPILVWIGAAGNIMPDTPTQRMPKGA